jgi:hypothetical protein
MSEYPPDNNVDTQEDEFQRAQALAAGDASDPRGEGPDQVDISGTGTGPGLISKIGDIAKWTAPVIGTAAAEITERPNFFEGEDLTVGQKFGIGVAKFAMNRVHERIQARAA